jgi:drug/metabolite transporter (DMT)-like permease
MSPFRVAGLFYLGSGCGFGVGIIVQRLRTPDVVFREKVGTRVFLGIVATVAGGVVLSWHPGEVGIPVGASPIVGACPCQAIGNNLTRKVSTNDALVIACLKGLIATDRRESHKALTDWTHGP